MTCGNKEERYSPKVFDRVSLSFVTLKGRLNVVDDVSYDINDGDFIAVIRPSGCGKTTMMSTFAAFQKPTTRKVLFDGRPVAGLGPKRGVIGGDIRGTDPRGYFRPRRQLVLTWTPPPHGDYAPRSYTVGLNFFVGWFDPSA